MSNIYVIGRHAFNVFEDGVGWGLSVNGILVEGRFATRSDAWEAGVAEVDRLDRRCGKPPPPGSVAEKGPA
jgi:hypothetical protein